jgi:hypothetical protein
MKPVNPTRKGRRPPNPAVLRRNEPSDEALMRDHLRLMGNSESEIQQTVNESSEEARVNTLKGKAKKGVKK